MAGESIDLEIKNWNEFQPRKDLKSLSWIRIQSDVFFSENFFYLDNNQKLLFFYVLTYAGKKNSNKITLNLDFTIEKLKLEKSEILSGIKKLESLKILTASVRDRDDIVSLTCTTNDTERNDTERNDTERNDTERNDTEQTNELDLVSDKVQQFVNFWNSETFTTDSGEIRSLPKIQKISDSRKKKINKRLAEAEFDYKKAIPMILESDFCMGSEGWAVSFDWFIANDSNYIKVLEGNYKNKPKKSNQPLTDHFHQQAKFLGVIK